MSSDANMPRTALPEEKHVVSVRAPREGEVLNPAHIRKIEGGLSLTSQHCATRQISLPPVPQVPGQSDAN